MRGLDCFGDDLVTLTRRYQPRVETHTRIPHSHDVQMDAPPTMRADIGGSPPELLGLLRSNP